METFFFQSSSSSMDPSHPDFGLYVLHHDSDEEIDWEATNELPTMEKIKEVSELIEIKPR